MSLLGLIAVVSASTFIGPGVVGSMHARQEAEYLKTILRLARTTAVLNGNVVNLNVSGQGGYAVSDASGELLQPEHHFAPGTTVQWSDTSLVFLPSGMTDRSFSVLFESDSRGWQVEVLSATGQVSIRELWLP